MNMKKIERKRISLVEELIHERISKEYERMDTMAIVAGFGAVVPFDSADANSEWNMDNYDDVMSIIMDERY